MCLPSEKTLRSGRDRRAFLSVRNCSFGEKQYLCDCKSYWIDTSSCPSNSLRASSWAGPIVCSLTWPSRLPEHRSPFLAEISCAFKVTRKSQGVGRAGQWRTQQILRRCLGKRTPQYGHIQGWDCALPEARIKGNFPLQQTASHIWSLTWSYHEIPHKQTRAHKNADCRTPQIPLHAGLADAYQTIN